MINFTCIKCGAPNSNIYVSDGAKTVSCAYCNTANDVISKQQETAPAVTPQITTVHKPHCWAVGHSYVVIGGPRCQGCGVLVKPGTTNHIKGASMPTEKIVIPGRGSPLSGCFRFAGGAFGFVFWIGSAILFGFVLFVLYGYLNQPYNAWSSMMFNSWVFKDWNLLVAPWVYFEWIAHFVLIVIVFIITITPTLLYVVGGAIEVVNILVGWVFWPGLMSGTITIGDALDFFTE